MIRRLLLLLFLSSLLLLPAGAEDFAVPVVVAPTPLLGNWLTTAAQFNGHTVFYYQTFGPDLHWSFTLIIRDRLGKLTRAQGTGNYRFEKLLDAYRITTWPLDWS